MAKPYRRWARYLRWILAAGLVVAFAAWYPKYWGFFYHWGHSHSTGVIQARSWLIASMVIVGAVVLVMIAELFVLALPVARGLVNERRGRSARAAECYKRALSCYLGGGYFPFRNACRMIGLGLFAWKSEALEQTLDETATLKALQSAIDHLQRSPYRLLMGNALAQDFGGISKNIGTLEGVSEIEDLLREGELTHLEKRAETGSDDLNRGMTLYELGHYQRALAFFDQAIDAYQRSGDTDMAEVPRLLGALAAWEYGDHDDCERRVRGWRPADLDLRLWVLGLRCLLASAQGKTGKALATLERTAARVRDGSADPGALAWLATVRATVLRTAGRYDDALNCAGQAADHFQQAGPTLALDSRLEMARALIGLGRHDEALAVAARATAELDALRYQLDFTENRFAFTSGQGTARALALELASASAPRLTAELVEGARVQGLPTPREDHARIDAVQADHRKRRSRPLGRASSSEPSSAEQDAQPAGRTAVGLASLGPARRLDLFVPGDSELSRLAPDLDLKSAGRVVLAQVAEAVAGKDWLWWGSWAAGAQLYWSLISHTGTVEAGAIPMASLAPALTRLLEALPTPLAAETSGNAARAQKGAFARPETALDLLGELGALLIPSTLRHLALARAASGQPLSLVVAPASPLGRVPFGLLGLGQPDTHLAHGAIIQLGLPAALLDQVRLRQPAPCNSQVLSVIDPCSRKAEPPDKHAAEPAEDKTLDLVGRGQLNEMGITGWAWLQHSPVLSRDEHLDELATVTDQAQQATIGELSKALRTTSAGILAYIGHVRHGSDDAPANASLILDDDDLQARDLLYDSKHRWPVPPRVALLGCGSGGAQAPEWLGLAPAAVWAGAEIVAATAWDLIDEAETWRLADEVVTILVQSPDPAAEWRRRLIDHLAAWTTQVHAPSPLSWGAIQFTGLSPDRPKPASPNSGIDILNLDRHNPGRASPGPGHDDRARQ